MRDESFIIKDLDSFINSSRRLVFDHFGSPETSQIDILSELNAEDQKELDEVLSYTEALSIVQSFIKKQQHKKTSEIRYIVTDKSYLSIIHALNDRLVSNLLNNLVNKGLIETAFDEESNDFIFWVKDEHKQDIKKNSQPPETD